MDHRGSSVDRRTRAGVRAGGCACRPARPPAPSPRSDGAPSAQGGPGPVVAVVGDLCDELHECSRTAAVVAALDPADACSWRADNAYVEPAPWQRVPRRTTTRHYGPFKAQDPSRRREPRVRNRGRRRVLRLLQRRGAPSTVRPVPANRGYYSLDLGAWHVSRAQQQPSPRHVGTREQEVWLRERPRGQHPALHDGRRSTIRASTSATPRTRRLGPGALPGAAGLPGRPRRRTGTTTTTALGADDRVGRTGTAVHAAIRAVRRRNPAGSALYPIGRLGPDVRETRAADTWASSLKLSLSGPR